MNEAINLALIALKQPDLVAKTPESVWLCRDKYGESIVSQYLRFGGIAKAVPESVWPKYLSLVSSGSSDRWANAGSLARLSHERPDIVARVPESEWMRDCKYCEPLLGWYLRFGGAASAVPDPALAEYMAWIDSTCANYKLGEKACGLAELSVQRPNLVLQVPEAVWMQTHSGESVVSIYLRCGGDINAVPQTVRQLSHRKP